MKTFVFSMHSFEKEYLLKANSGRHDLRMLDVRLDHQTAALAKDCEAASLFVTDHASTEALTVLRENGVQYLALRSAGFNHAELVAAKFGQEFYNYQAKVPAIFPRFGHWKERIQYN